MGDNSTCFCGKKVESVSEWCYYWRPPPFPDIFPEHLRKEYINTIEKNKDGYQQYINMCGGEIPTIKPSSSTPSPTLSLTITTATTTVVPILDNSADSVTGLSRSLLPTTINTTQQIKETYSTVTQSTEADTTHSSVTTPASAAIAGGAIAGIVILVLLVLIALAVILWWYFWKHYKKGTGSINSLPMEKYTNTNFLDNKARANLSWNQSPNQQTTDQSCKGNFYGSLPAENSLSQYVKAPNRKSHEVQVESPREFDKMKGSVSSVGKLGYDNENFDENGEESPGTSSQTPLFDMIDGSVLPNEVPSSSLKKSNETDDKPVPGGKLPPIDMSIQTSKTSLTDKKSPKKKKQIYLQRKSAPVQGIDDILQDMAGNRKSV